MSTKILRAESNERIDLTDFNFMVDEAMQSGFRQPFDQFMTDPAGAQAFIIDGFEITNPSGQQIQVDLGRAILGSRDGSLTYVGNLTSEGAANRIVDVTAFADATYQIYIRFEYVDSDEASRVFWDASGAGSEFSQTVATRKEANWSMRIETGSPGAEWLQIGSLTKAGGVITVGPTDERNLYFEGTVDSTYDSGWSTDGGGGANDRNADRQQYGVKDLQTFTAAMRQCVEDIKGRGLRRWWERDIGGMNIGFDAAPVEDQLAVGNADTYFGISSGDPRVQLASGYWIDLTSNVYRFVAASVVKMELSGNGLEVNDGLVVGSTGLTPVADQIKIGDNIFTIDYNSGNPQINFDSSGYIGYNRSGGNMSLDIALGGSYYFAIDSSSKATLSTTGLNLSAGLAVGLGAAPISDRITLGNSNFYLYWDGTDPFLYLDSTDYFQYDRSLNELHLSVGGDKGHVFGNSGSQAYTRIGNAAARGSLRLYDGSNDATDEVASSGNVVLYAKYVVSPEIDATLWVDDTSGATQLSPHNEQGEWVFNNYNRMRGIHMVINMEDVIREVEKLSGKTLIQVTKLEGERQ